jgi:methylated-DNA-protein-cysteine methyltransferase-like protein
MARSPAFDRLKREVLSVLHDIPAGRVTTYGAIADYLGAGPRQVARVLSSLSEAESEGVPWHRVVGAGGSIRTPGDRQSQRLRREGVHVTAGNRVAGFGALLFTPG